MPPKNTAVRPVKKKRVFNPVAYVTNAARKAWMWSAVRKKALAVGYCEECGAVDVPLVIHHRIEAQVYAHAKRLIELLIPENTDDLDCLCKECHKLAHRRDK